MTLRERMHERVQGGGVVSKTDPSPQPGNKVSKPLPRWVWINFLLVGLLWFGVIVWSWLFTDLRIEPLLGALANLGVFLAPLWLLKRLPDLSTRWDEKLRKFLGRLVASRATFAVLLGLLVAGAVASLGAGTVQLSSELEREVRVEVRRAGDAEGAAFSLPAGERLRRPLWTGLGGAAEVTVEAVGYPPTAVTVRPWRRPTVQVPTELRRTAVLLHPSGELSDFATSVPMELTVELPGETEPRHLAFDGHPVWIGCTEECPVPEPLLQRWRQRFGERPGLLERLTRPRSLDGDLPQLEKDDRIEVAVTVHGRPLAGHTVTVDGTPDQTEELHVQP